MLMSSWYCSSTFQPSLFPCTGRKQTTSVLCFGGSYAHCDEHLLRLLLFLLLHHQLLLSLSLSLFLLHFQFAILFFCSLVLSRSHPPLSTLRCFSCRTSDPRQSWMKVRAGIWRRIFFSSYIFNDTFFPLLSRGWVSYSNILMPSFETEKFIYISQKKKKNKSSRFWRMLSSLYEYVTFNIRVCVDFPCNFS